MGRDGQDAAVGEDARMNRIVPHRGKAADLSGTREERVNAVASLGRGNVRADGAAVDHGDLARPDGREAWPVALIGWGIGQGVGLGRVERPPVAVDDDLRRARAIEGAARARGRARDE